MTCRTGWRADLTLSQAASTPSSVSPAAAASRAEDTTEAMVLLRSTSPLPSFRAGSSIWSTPRRSRVRAISTCSRDDDFSPRYHPASRPAGRALIGLQQAPARITEADP